MLKKIVFILCAACLCAVIAHRAIAIGDENNFVVFNAARAADADGLPVDAIVAEKRDGVLRIPLSVKNGRAWVDGAKISKFRIGQTVGVNGRVIAVSRVVDLDTGMFALSVRGADGDTFAEFAEHGFFVPIDAIQDGHVFVARGGIAEIIPVKIINQDIENAVISGVDAGDVIILSRVESGQKLRIK